MISKIIKYQNSQTKAENSPRFTLSLSNGRIFGLIIFSFLIINFSFLIPNLVEASTLKAPPSNLGLVAYYPLNESSGTNAYDASGKNHTSGTFSGTPTWTSGKHFGGLNFPGSSYFVAPSSSDFAFGTGDFTVSGWFKMPSLGARQCFWETGNGGGGTGVTYLLRETNGTLTVGAHGIGALLNYTWSTTATNTWYHIVVTRTGTSLQTYINGVSVASATNSSSLGQQGFTVGIVTTPCYFIGVADDVRIYTRGLTTAEINTLYKAGEVKLGATQSTGSLSSGLVGHWTFDGKNITNGRIDDASGQGNHGSATNIATSTFYVSGQLGQAGNFDGVDDKVSFTSTNYGTTHSVSFWINYRDAGDGVVVGGASGYYAPYIDGPGAGNTIKYADGGGNSVASVVHGGFTSGVWYYITVVRDGASVSFYKNAVQLGATQTLGVSVAEILSTLGSYSGGTFPTAMVLDDVRIYNRALSQAEITRLYNLGRPTVIKDIDKYFSNVVLSLHLNGTDGSTTFTDSSRSPKTVTPSGNAQIDTAQSKFGGASGLFDGTGDYIAPASSVDYAFGTGDFTAEWWVRSTDGTANWIGLTGAGALAGAWMSVVVSNTFYWQTAYGATNLYSFSAGPILDGNWHHVAISRNGSNHRVFFDGVQQIDTVTDTTNYNVTSIMAIGTGVNGDFNGWFDDVRITKGVARYTTNFIPPPRQFPDR